MSTKPKWDKYYPYGKYLSVSEHNGREALRRIKCEREGRPFKARAWVGRKEGPSGVGYAAAFSEHYDTETADWETKQQKEGQAARTR